MFIVGFLAGSFSGMFFPETWSIYIFIVFGIILGLIMARFSHKLLKLQIFIVSFFMVYLVLPPILERLLKHIIANPAIIVYTCSIIAAIISGIIAIKYKFIITIITTSLLGATQCVATIAHAFNIQNWLIKLIACTVLTVAGIAVQFIVEEKTEKKHEENPIPTSKV